MKISLCVVIPVFNNPVGLARTLDSLAFCKPTFDVLVVDDGSEIPINPDYDACLAGRIHLLRLNRNVGITRALNEAFQWVTEHNYEYIGRLDSSDIVVPERFTLQHAYLHEHPNCALVGSYIEFCDKTGKRLFEFTAPSNNQDIKRRLRRENCLIHSGVMIRSSILKSVGMYNPMHTVTEDYDLFCRIATKAEVGVIPQVLTRCEYNFGGISVTRRRLQQWQKLAIQINHFAPLAWESYYGLSRTIVALLTPHTLALARKKILLHSKAHL